MTTIWHDTAKTGQKGFFFKMHLSSFWISFTMIIKPMWIISLFALLNFFYFLSLYISWEEQITIFRHCWQMLQISMPIHHLHLDWTDLAVNGICLFWQLNGIWGVGVVPSPLRSQELQKVWPWNFYQMLLFIKRHEIEKNFLT